jgi:hypothetical protein
MQAKKKLGDFGKCHLKHLNTSFESRRSAEKSVHIFGHGERQELRQVAEDGFTVTQTSAADDLYRNLAQTLPRSLSE